MMVKAILTKTFYTYTEVLQYTTVVDEELHYNQMKYACEISFRVIFNDYKVVYKVYDIG